MPGNLSGWTDGWTDMPQNGHGWSDGPTDTCTGEKRIYQASDRRTDWQPENIMPPAPKGGGMSEVKGQGHIVGLTRLIHIPFAPCQLTLPSLIELFQNLTLKIQVQSHNHDKWVKVQSHKVGATSCRLISLLFPVNRSFHSWDTALSNFDLENQSQGHS